MSTYLREPIVDRRHDLKNLCYHFDLIQFLSCRHVEKTKNLSYRKRSREWSMGTYVEVNFTTFQVQ
jgi:activator of HSP90 ATPase